MSKLKQNQFLYFVIVVLVFLALAWRLFNSLDEPGFERWDEQTNAQIVREIVRGSEEGKYDLTINGQPFFEKPPLWYYTNALIAKFFGVSPGSLRAVSVVATFGTFLLVFLIVYKFNSHWKALLSIIFLLFIQQFYQINAGDYFSSHTLRTADLDALQIFFLIAAQFVFLQSTRNWGKKYVALSYVFLALAFMTKGWLALIGMFIMTFYYFLHKDNYKFTKLNIVLMSGLVAVIIVPWHLYMGVKFGSTFLNSYFGYHVINRAFLDLEGHKETLLFYPGILMSLKLNPLWPFLFWSIGNTLHKGKLKLVSRYNLIYAVVLLIIITIMQTKLAWYILYLYFALILI